MIDKPIQYGNLRPIEDIKLIVVHNTSNYEMNARQLYNWLKNENTSSRACHYLVDSEEVIQVTSLDHIAWNSGVANDQANKYGIAIEICSDRDRNKYLQAEQRAVNLIKKLLKKYHLTKDDIYFHNDFCLYVNCPSTILQIYGNKKNFIDKYF